MADEMGRAELRNLEEAVDGLLHEIRPGFPGETEEEEEEKQWKRRGGATADEERGKRVVAWRAADGKNKERPPPLIAFDSDCRGKGAGEREDAARKRIV